MTKPVWREKPPQEYQGNLTETLTLRCPADGTPPLEIIWKKDGYVIEEDDRLKMNNYQLYFEKLLLEDNGNYTCEVSNRAGSLSASFTVVVQNTDQDDQETSEATTPSIMGLLMAVVVVLGLLYCRRAYQKMKNWLGLPLNDQKRFMEGDPSRLNPDIPLEQQAELLPYNPQFEVARESIVLGKLLGAGNFARVYKATVLDLLPDEDRTTVAVKMVSSRIDCMQLKAMRSEVKIMIHIGQHINIVNLLGACSEDLASKGELLLILEYCRHGNILDYMHRYRFEFINQINEDDKFDSELPELLPAAHPSDSSSSTTNQPSDGATTASSMSTLLPRCVTGGDAASRSPTKVATGGRFLHRGTSPGTSGSSPTPKSVDVFLDTFSTTHVLGWAYQIAKGMQYLASKKVVHTDLAARNVLLAPNNIIKISDFGLSKQIYKKDNYKNKRRGLMPVKWLAIECLRDGVYSTQGDVWSFGVVLWEIFSLGQMPYACTEVDEHFVNKLEDGLRLDHPRYANKPLYQMMLDCWSSDPMARPTFTSLATSLAEMLGDKLVQRYQQLTAPYQQDNVSEFLDRIPSQDYTTKMGQTTSVPREDSPPLQQTEDRPASVHSEDRVVLELHHMASKYIKN